MEYFTIGPKQHRHSVRLRRRRAPCRDGKCRKRIDQGQTDRRASRVLRRGGGTAANRFTEKLASSGARVLAGRKIATADTVTTVATTNDKLPTASLCACGKRNKPSSSRPRSVFHTRLAGPVSCARRAQPVVSRTSKLACPRPSFRTRTNKIVRERTSSSRRGTEGGGGAEKRKEANKKGSLLYRAATVNAVRTARRNRCRLPSVIRRNPKGYRGRH